MSDVRDQIRERLARELPNYESGILAEQVEAFHRVTVQRDQARRIAASLEAELAEVRDLHSPVSFAGAAYCTSCGGTSWVSWPCATAKAVYL